MRDDGNERVGRTDGLRIVVYTPHYLPATRYGGPVQSVHGLCAALVKRGHEVTVFTTNVDGPGMLDVALGEPVDLDGVKVRYFATGFPKRLFRSPALERALEAVLPDTDVVHINGTYLWPGPAVARLARRHGVPYIHAPRGMLLPDLIEGKSALVKRLWITLLERRALEGAAALHATSADEADALRAMFEDLPPIHIVGNAVSTPKRSPDKALVDKIFADIPVGRRMVYLGRLDWMKGVDLAIDVLAHLPNVHLLVAGPDQLDQQPELERRARGHGIGERLHFLGQIDGDRKWALLSGADVMIVPSTHESFGMSAAEALAVGTPVVTSPSVGVSDIIASIDPACVTQRSAEAMAYGVRGMLDDEDRRKAFALKAEDVMRRDHRWETRAIEMERIFHDAAPSGRGAGRR